MDVLFSRKKKAIVAIIIFSVLLNVVFLVSSLLKLSPTPTTQKQSTLAKNATSTTPAAQGLATATQATVTKVIDGDTFEISGGQKVRMIGIDTPETVDPRRPVMCFGKNASDKSKELLQGKTVTLEKDVSETDKYGRLLRYVYLGNVFVNKYLVEEGFAHATSYPPDVKYQDVFRKAETKAREQNKGLWADCNSPSPTANLNFQTPTPQVMSATDNRGDKDCKDFKTHAEAQAYFDSKGGSPASNVDKLDGSDHDGIVCETLP